MPATATNTRRDWLDVLRRINACDDGMEWAEAHGALTARQAWEKCERGDWMIYVAANLGVDRELIVTAACDCAGEDQPSRPIETARAWVRGEATIEQVRAAAKDAAAAAACAASVAFATDLAAFAALSVASAAYACAAAAAAPDADAAAAACADLCSQTLRKCAGLVRKAIPWQSVEARLDHMNGAKQ